MKRKALFFTIMVALLVLSNCQSDRPTPTAPKTGETTEGKARVESIDILILESFPVQVHVVAKGNLPDGCSRIDKIDRERKGDTFEITISTARIAEALCTEALVPFEETIPLDVLGLAAGTYTVTVNEVSDTFELAMDNVPQTGDSGPQGGEIISGTAPVDSIEINILESMPVQLSVVIRGNLPDSCTTISRPEEMRNGDTISLNLITERPADAVCTQVLTPFEETVLLDIEGLPAGVYTVAVGGVTGSFELMVDNVAVLEPMAGCPPVRDGLIPYLNQSDGYCFLHAPYFEVEHPQPALLVITEMTPTEEVEPVRASLTIENEGAANGRTAEQVANDHLSEFEGRGIPIALGQVGLGGEVAVSADGVPGRAQVRQVFLVHDGTVFTFTLSPIDAAFPKATEQAEMLWNAVASSFTFIEE